MSNSTLWKALINQGSLSPYPNNASVFKINGNSLNEMSITPVEDCVVDFGDGTTQTFTGNNSSTQVSHSYSESNIYTIKITGNHSNFRAPKNIIEIIQISNSITDCSQMFYGCSSLTAIPSTLTIPDSVTDCSRMFNSCSSLTSDISNIWPSTWNSTKIIKLYAMFNDCSKVVGIVPADKLWNSGKTFSSSSCFRNCTSLTNYNEIPAEWK